MTTMTVSGSTGTTTAKDGYVMNDANSTVLFSDENRIVHQIQLDPTSYARVAEFYHQTPAFDVLLSLDGEKLNLAASWIDTEQEALDWIYKNYDKYKNY